MTKNVSRRLIESYSIKSLLSLTSCLVLMGCTAQISDSFELLNSDEICLKGEDDEQMITLKARGSAYTAITLGDQAHIDIPDKISLVSGSLGKKSVSLYWQDNLKSSPVYCKYRPKGDSYILEKCDKGVKSKSRVKVLRIGLGFEDRKDLGTAGVAVTIPIHNRVTLPASCAIAPTVSPSPTPSPSASPSPSPSPSASPSPSPSPSASPSPSPSPTANPSPSPSPSPDPATQTVLLKMCNDPNTSAKAKHTIDTLMYTYNTTTCDDLNRQILSLDSLYIMGKQLPPPTIIPGVFHMISRRENPMIEDLSPLEGMLQLKEIDLPMNRISDIGPLSSLLNLEFLSLKGNNISDLTPLLPLKKLKGVDISGNPIKVIPEGLNRDLLLF